MKVIHVAGTKEKFRLPVSLFRASGKRIQDGALYFTVLERFTERMEYNGSEISEEDLIRYTELVLEKVEVMLSEGLNRRRNSS
jgi:folylpolyglutamate synthase/dihydropteroate synthase